MVVFTCELCFAVLKKQQIDKHCIGKCKDAWDFTCVECGKTFSGYDYKDHNECMTEVQKYQGQFLEKKRQEKADQKEKQKQKSAAAKKDSEEEKAESSQSDEEKVSSKISKHLGEDKNF